MTFDLKEMYEIQKLSLSEIEKVSGISRYVLKKKLLSLGVEIRDPKTSSIMKNTDKNIQCPNVEKLIEMVETGNSRAKIIKEFNTTSNQVDRWLTQHSLVIKPNKYVKKEIPNKEELLEIINTDVTYEEMSKKYNVSYPTLMKWLKKYGILRDDKLKYQIMNKTIVSKKRENYGYDHFPDEVYEYRSTSKGELDLKEFVNSNGGNFSKKHFYINENKTRRELDMIDEKRKIAIEFSGAFWHCEYNNTDKNYHFDKWKYCNDNDIQLLTFWDIEYYKRSEQIKSFIKSKLGVFDMRVYARDLHFKEIMYKCHNFFEINHIQGGKCSIDRNFALLDKNENIIGCVSYAKHHRNSEILTLNRLAFSSGIQVVGGVAKILKNSLELINSDVVTWSDNRYSTGEIYSKNGFEFDGNIKPDYSYFDIKSNTILSKQSQQKSKINCPKDMTEHEFCKSLGRYRLWDCGKKRFVHKKKGAVRLLF